MGNKREKEFTELIELNQGIIHKITKIYGNNRDEQNDLFQEIVYQLWKSYDSFQGNSKFSTWMYRVSLNTAITIFRKKKIKYASLDDISFKIKSEEYDSEVEDQLKMLYAAIKKLNDIEKAMVFLYLENRPGKEIAETLGISEVNARVKMNRIKTKLKKIIQENNYD
ncbi:ECF RNA polymerase sigma factor SigW [Flavobacteriaceae bacterium UJ101]|nr:ECF RNA polymerase sigma factor SigW [Flavobacteriaceae bacterium UJ101]